MKNQTTHTPKPWKLFPESTVIFGEDKLVIADTAPSNDHISYRIAGVNMANARLIVTAPELLEQLQHLVGIICSLEGFEERDVTIEDCDEAKAIILKATGS